MKKHNRNLVNAIDLFAGCGGSSWGARNAGVEIRAAIDSWKLAQDTYLDNFPDVDYFNDLVENVNPADLEVKIGKVDLILASPECTNHTCARGARERSEDSRMTAFEVIKFARILKPRWIIIENVVHMKKWELYKEYIRILKDDLGYHVSEQTIDASMFGVPQSRRRLFILCDNKKMPPLVINKSKSQRFVREIIDYNGNHQFTILASTKRSSNTLQRAERAFTQIGRDTPFLLVYYGSDAAGGWQTLDRPLRTVTTVDRFGLVKPSDCGHMMRMLQVPEIRLAMGFTSNFKLNFGTRRDKIHLLGNAVCPPVMEAIVKEMIFSEKKKAS